MAVTRILLVAACVLVLVYLAFQFVERSVRVVTDIAIDPELMVSELLESCGYGRDGTPSPRPFSEECVTAIRGFVRASSTKGNVVALQQPNRSGRICVAELLELPDKELVEQVAGWLATDARANGSIMPAELGVLSELVAKYSC